MECIKLELKTPNLTELNYRRNLLADAETMSYNKGYSESDNYNKETGCIDFNENSWNDWYCRWINNMPNRYYAYIMKVDQNIPIGEVALRYVDEKKAYCVNLIVEAKFRGNGFSKQALKLLIDIAFNELGANKIFDEFPKSRTSAEKVFEILGFKRISDDIVELTKEEYYKCLEILF